MPNNNNQKLNPLARQALNKMKVEVAAELGIPDYDKIDKGNLTARQNGVIGGNMVRKMVQMAEDIMAQPNNNMVEQIMDNNATLETPQNSQ